MSDKELYKILEGFRSASEEEVYKPVSEEEVDEGQTKIEKQGNKVVVTKDGDRTEFDDEETAAMFMGGDEDQMQEDVEEVLEDDDEQLDEKWDTETDTPKSERGKYKGKTKAELQKMLSNVKKTGPHKKGSAEYERQNELEFAIRAKSDWGKVSEEEEVNETEQLDEFLPALAAAGGALARTAATAAGTSFGASAADKVFGEGEEAEFSTFDPENPSHRKALQRGTPVVLSPEVCTDPKGDRTGVFMNMGKSGFFGKVMRNCDGKQINVHLSDIVSADITNNSIYESLNDQFEAVMEEITVTTTTNPDSPENDTMTVTGVGPDAVDELEAIMQNAGMAKDYEAPMPTDAVVDTGEPAEPEMGPEEPETLSASCGSVHEDSEGGYDFQDEMETELTGDDGETTPGTVSFAGNIVDGKVVIDPTSIRASAHHMDGNSKLGFDDDFDTEMFLGDQYGMEELQGYAEEKYGQGVAEERDIEHANTPDEELADIQALIQGMAGGLNKPKKMYKKEYPGDNPMAVEEEEIDEVAPPGQEEWIKKHKQEFIDQYGKEKGTSVLYATAWKRHNENESVQRPGQALDETESFLNLYKTFSER